MKHALVLLAAAFLMLIGGCVRSLRPFYLDSQLTYDPALEGRWIDADETASLVVTGDAKAKEYHIAYTDKDGKHGQFVARLAEVQGHRLLDIMPQEEKSDEQSDTYKAYLIPVHTCMLIDNSSTDWLRVTQMSYDWFKEYIRQHPGEIANCKVADESYMLTAPTDKLQAFMFKHLKTPDAYNKPTVLYRLVPATTDRPNRSE